MLAGLSILLGLAGALAARPLAAFLGADATLMQDSAAYIGTLALFVPVICFKILLGFMGRLIEKPHLYLMGTVVTLITNIGLDYVAVKLMGLGTTGAAAATGLAYLAGLCVVAGPYLSRKTVLNIWQGRFSGREIARAAYNGASEGVTYAAGALTVFLLNRSFMALSGPEGVAAFTVISYLGNFVTLLMFGMADGVSPILSSNCGAGQQGRIRRTLRAADGAAGAEKPGGAHPGPLAWRARAGRDGGGNAETAHCSDDARRRTQGGRTVSRDGDAV